jgi:hypothetical protein
LAAVRHEEHGGQTWCLLVDVLNYLLASADNFPSHQVTQTALRDAALYLSELMLDGVPPS